ncbi:MAG: hypothetical protein PHV75_04990 [Victivallaceae bacterium]|jgi:hypothetical protein|nr:hypothetical protein [Victivallaceae bacterium]NLK84302.1 hypothetical protein [Lentisphaerota bacterium]MDD3116811.1 hypothetical protein [Victivallaceae bacterium]MDD3702602.1 hypothetical protein [Victivallaceae bacterium]MDD4317854.1 hypothetical protein [Victivallaceae bacterium]
MIEQLKELFIAGDEVVLNFNTGFAAGVATAILILFLLFLLKLIIVIICRRRKSNGVLINGEHGGIFISATAITSTIMGLESEFRDFLIQKVKLYCVGHGKVFIWVQLCKDERARDFVPKAEQFQRRALNILKEMFGIDNIDRVEIKLKEPIRLKGHEQELDIAGSPDKPVTVFAPEPTPETNESAK